MSDEELTAFLDCLRDPAQRKEIFIFWDGWSEDIAKKDPRSSKIGLIPDFWETLIQGIQVGRALLDWPDMPRDHIAERLRALESWRSFAPPV